MATQVNYYQLLGISLHAQPKAIEKAYQIALAKIPEIRYEDREWYQNQVMDAYGVLKDPEKRAAYNQQLGLNAVAVPGFWQRFLISMGFRKSESHKHFREDRPSTTELMDFDWESVDIEVSDTRQENKKFWDEVYFKILVVAVVVAVLAWIYYLAQN